MIKLETYTYILSTHIALPNSQSLVERVCIFPIVGGYQVLIDTKKRWCSIDCYISTFNDNEKTHGITIFHEDDSELMSTVEFSVPEQFKNNNLIQHTTIEKDQISLTFIKSEYLMPCAKNIEVFENKEQL